MIEFMLLAAPRSATTWASNWLTTDTTLCMHDPLWMHHYKELDAINTEKMLGVSCTGLPLFHQWVNKHSARKVILHRNTGEVNTSLASIGLPSLGDEWNGLLEKIDGMHCNWRELFDNPKPIYEYLLQHPFDIDRHAQLKMIEMQPYFAGLTIRKDVTKRLMKEMQACL